MNDLTIILSLGFLFILVVSGFDLFESVVVFVEQYEQWELGNLLILSVYLTFALGVFSLRRWMELENALLLQKQAEENLREKDERYRALFEHSNDAIIILDKEKVLDLNNKCREALGIKQARLENVSLMSLIPGEFLPAAEEALKNTLETGSARFEMTFEKPDGSVIDVEVSSSLLKIEENVIQLVAQDITSRKKAEKWDRESRERLKTLLDNTLCGILLVDAATHEIVDVNPAASGAIGLPEDQIIGKVCHRFICPAEKERCPISNLGQKIDKSEKLLLNAKGESFPVLKSVVPVMIGDKKYLIESFVDLSESKKAERELLEAKLTAESANRAKSEFLATMSHELRTPLTAIIGFSDVMLGGITGELGDQNKRFVNNIATSGKHLLSLINNILDLSKIEAGKMELELEKFSIQDVFADTRAVTSALALKKNISLKFNVEDNFFINADRIRFKQVLYNLVSNAVKFTPEGGDVGISASKTRDVVKVAVSDTGIGISKEAQKLLFQPFKQVDSDINRQYEGTGLGLALVKKFVELHGGRVWVESEPGKGSTFTFELSSKYEELPEIYLERTGSSETEIYDAAGNAKGNEAGKAEAGGDEARKAEAGEETEIPFIIEPEGARGTEPLVLVVEDDEMSRELLVFTLNDAGYRVATVSSGKEALLLVHKMKPFLITLDIMLPGINGWDVLKNLKEDSATADIPVLVISMDDDKNCSLLCGAFDHLVKPVQKDLFLSTLEKVKEKTEKSSPKILIVDDEPAIVELLGSIVEQEGYEFFCAYGGKEAISKTLNFLPDALILDLMMPEVTGFDVIKALKENPETVDIPIIVCTAKDLSFEEKELLNRNVSYVMQKGDLTREKLMSFLNKFRANTYEDSKELLMSN
ncbi:response regulator [Methanosarcina sp. KYL-1]|uniref:hybrid sensor histidine kinase/response regulator n=1 Tax=Methanosarcina sp. KYL-1 TaxID=2602068 RepID=UPI002100946F|nr:response regulator [Methanosarcina sp. KYL-1]